MAQNVKISRVEDGFLRSVGLGADLVRPLSWVIDSSGIYYDSTRPCDLERTLQNTRFPQELIERASRLRSRIVEGGLTKYNVGSACWARPSCSRRVILVPGQVETDASIRFGAPGINTNLGLIRSVRKTNPDAYLIYKPHPDVVAGLRAKGKKEEDAGHFCDEIITGVSMGQLLQSVDEVHVLTSLAGFEALLRGKKVVCYGQPFYSGWGLTTDIVAPARRTRRLGLDELVAGALICYPIYKNSTGRHSTPEETLDELMAWRQSCNYRPRWRHQALRLALRHIALR